jgi:hypothetical protein
MSKQTAVDWLIEQLTPSISLQQKHIDDLKEKAKAMEKQQIIEACNQIEVIGLDNELPGEKYYNETFNK